MTDEKTNPITALGETNWRGKRKRFGIRREDRLSHLYVIGKTGTGKSTLMETMIRQDIARGEGVALLDPHGDLAERVKNAVPEERKQDLVYFDVPNPFQPLGFNPLDQVPHVNRPLVASNVLEAFKKIWADSWGPRLEHILRNALLALLDRPGSTLADIPRLLQEDGFRKEVCRKVANSQVRDFWLREYGGYPRNFRAEAIAPVQNKVGAFLANPVLRNILTEPTNTIDLKKVMDEGKILVVNLSKGRLGEDSAALLGALLVSRLAVAALGRAMVPEHERKTFFVYLDEFQSFTTLSLATMLSELRKYRVGLTLAHQYLAQLELEVRDAILGNVGSILAFRMGLGDAEILEREFRPEFRAGDLVQLPNYHTYLKLMVDGRVSEAFSAVTTTNSPSTQ